MVRAGIAPPQPKKKPAKKAQIQRGFNTDIPSKDGTQSMVGGYGMGGGPKSNLGLIDKHMELTNSERKAQTLGSDNEN